jgi:hypothetical protein
MSGDMIFFISLCSLAAYAFWRLGEVTHDKK